MKAILRGIRISPKKANLVAALVRNKKAQDAIDILRFTPKRTSLVLKKLIESAVANAVNNFKQTKETLGIKEIIVTEGPTYKRSMPVSRGRQHPILKRSSHITVKLEAVGEAPAKTAKKATVKKSTKTAKAETETTETTEESNQ